MTAFEVVLDGVTHRYSRSRAPALVEADLELGAGVVGLVGPNGAGKTTLLKLLLGLLEPERGTIRICGMLPAAFRRTRGLGFIPERPSFPEYLTVAEFLEAFAVLQGSASPMIGADPAIGRMKLGELMDFRLGALSLGQKRRVEVTAALMGDPDLVLLDEPTNGLDPFALAQFRALILEARRPGRLILVSSHHLDELDRIAERVVLLNEGRVQGNWSAEEVHSSSGSFHEHFTRTVVLNEG